MKKNIFLYSALALGMTGMFASCSSDDVVEVSGGNTGTDATAQVIEIAVENNNGDTQTRARELYSSEAKQSIENVKVIITEGQVVKYVKTFTDWCGDDSETYGATYSDDAANGRKATITLTGEDKLEAGKIYTIYAIGYHNKSAYTVNSESLNDYLDGINTTGENTTFDKNLILATTSATAEEIFAGSTENVSVSEGGGVSANVYLHRQVAGVYTYVKSIPYVVENEKQADMLQLVAIKNNKNLVLGNFYPTSGELGTNGKPSNGSGNVVNGFGGTDNTVTTLYEINLKNWFNDITKHETHESGGEFITPGTKEDEYSNWKNPYRSDDEVKAVFEKGSVFGGAFVIPFKVDVSTATYNTLQLQLVNSEAKNAPLRTWNINMPSDEYINGGKLTWWNTTMTGGAGFQTDENVTENKNKYSILRNHLYGVGQRTSDKPGSTPEDPDPEDPDPDTPDDGDEPEDLDNNQSLTLFVNANWEIIHDMELE